MEASRVLMDLGLIQRGELVKPCSRECVASQVVEKSSTSVTSAKFLGLLPTFSDT